MSLNPLSHVKDYASMLNRLFLFTAIFASAATWLLRSHYQSFDDLLRPLDGIVDLPVLKEVTLLGYLLPGVVVAVLARAVRLHDRISDLFRIRQRFDINEIIHPLAEGCGHPIDVLATDKLRVARRRLMGQTFYRYASSTDPKIDKHLIYQALDWWSWYWVIVESVTVFIPTGIALLFSQQWWHGLVLLGLSLLLVICLRFFRSQCVRYARDEVHAILSDQTRKAEVSHEFRALSS